ncbi:MAG: PfkB family kinase, nonfunctional [Parcubacteria group bacterium GW2011_GWA1_49_11]|uniref:Carbohydrate kinase PfkB domain-containing protein n=1 Tax=Candidatus Yanofskybacteria bacterium RIFCSPHIGHO2_01_FULL_48_25b TaxID=1802672 RepID=A0A1F8F2W8_9BACT|nr:MAG: PfkB family kinase, nonfunctional [Parcubacteria group bacterium GW2011_GWA1_49_11]OGN07485.1 MAG: hypothetical protein A2669_02090 [Candidatus Yanofskybacteria bacterium RIFCSPHIGHO2_01_FULL_48_25b]
MFDVITIGSATRDVFLKSPGFAETASGDSPTGKNIVLPLGSKIEIEKIVLATGGSGTNTAVTFARQGLKTACIGVIGEDANGAAVLEEMAAENVDTRFFQKDADDLTAYSVILVSRSGERTILSYKGEGQHLSALKINPDDFETKWLNVGSLGGHFEILQKISEWAALKSVKLAFNPGTKELEFGLEKLKPIFKICQIVSVNQDEAARLTGLKYDDEAGIFKMMDEIVPGIFIMSKGHDGAAVSDGVNVYRAGVPDSPIVERTGAGDAFMSGFVSEYMKQTNNLSQITNDKETIIKAIQLGTANASSVVAQYGSKAGILKKGDIGPWPLVNVAVS